MNLVLDDTVEEMKTGEVNHIGMVVRSYYSFNFYDNNGILTIFVI